MVKHLVHTLQDSFEYDGKWWLPDDKDDQITGKLTFDPASGARLSLIGCLRKSQPYDPVFQCEILHGRTTNGVDCTLIDNHQISRVQNSPGMCEQTFSSIVLLLGTHLASHEQSQFSSCYSSYEHLDEWIVPEAFEFEDQFEGSSFLGYSVSLIRQEYFDVFVDGVNARFSLKNGISVPQKDAMRVNLRSEAELSIKPEIPLNLESFQKLITDINRLLTLLIGSNTRPRKIILFPLVLNGEEEKSSTPVSVFYRLIPSNTKPKVHRHSMHVNFSEIVERLPDILYNWLVKCQRIKTVKDLFFADLYNDGQLSESRFLNLVHALESYHRIVFGGKYIEQAEYDRQLPTILKGIPSTFPRDLRDALSKRLTYGNEISLRKRLKLLLNSLDSNLRSLITNNVNDFVEKTIATRNYYVHFDENTKDMALEWPQTLFYRQRLSLLVRILLLREIGFSDFESYEILHDQSDILPWE